MSKRISEVVARMLIKGMCGLHGHNLETLIEGVRYQVDLVRCKRCGQSFARDRGVSDDFLADVGSYQYYIDQIECESDSQELSNDRKVSRRFPPQDSGKTTKKQGRSQRSS